MFMEAYGSAGNWADSIIKQAASSIIGEKVAKEALSNGQGVDGSPQMNAGGIGAQADPSVVQQMDAVSNQKAMNSLNAKIESLESRRIYLEDMLSKREEENKKMSEKLGRLQLRKGGHR